jgi:hypothetical protein
LKSLHQLEYLILLIETRGVYMLMRERVLTTLGLYRARYRCGEHGVGATQALVVMSMLVKSEIQGEQRQF